ncbi:F-box protein CPR1-like [Silene latifolia]|uniref:F-box protein CPR1-like n=1 Tax=Silene latifolia TaxID=37657 RepID=UPI003D77C53E
MKQTRSNRSLPEEIIMEILSWLPVKTLLRFKSASKSLLNLIISSRFVKLHLRRSRNRNSNIILLRLGKSFLASFDVDHPERPIVQLDIHLDAIKLLEPLHSCNELRIPRIIGICNGVICFRTTENITLYNPATRVYRQVPRRLSHAWRRDELIVYDCVSDDFKIFSIIQYAKETELKDSEIYLHKLKNNSWSKIECPPRLFHSELSSSNIANNSLYWITFNYDSKNEMLMRFDVSSHRFEEIPLPIQIIRFRSWIIGMGVLKGRLHMMMFENGFNIWILKDDNCWTRVFYCSDWEYKLSSHSLKGFSPSLYGYSKDGRKIIIGPERLQKFKKVICCDLESQTISVVQVLGLPEGGTFTAVPWAESLVPLS